MHQDAVVDALRGRVYADPHGIDLLVIGPGRLVDAQYTVAVGKRVALNRRLGVRGRVDAAIRSVDIERPGRATERDRAVVGLLLLITGRLLDR